MSIINRMTNVAGDVLPGIILMSLNLCWIAQVRQKLNKHRAA